MNTEAVKFVSAGLFKSEGSWIHPRRIIDSCEIILMYEGTAYICEDGTEYTLGRNDVLILEPGREHYGFRTSEEYVSFAWLHYRTDCDRYKCPAKHITAAGSAALKILLTQCLHTVNTPGYDRVCADLYAALCLEEIIYNVKNAFVGQNRLAAEIKDYISLNRERELSVKLLADHFGYHENYISRLFKATYGMPLKKYISRQKLEYACALLNTTIYTVDRISTLLSFKSENHFIKFFEYHMGSTPTEYRNAHTGTHSNKA